MIDKGAWYRGNGIGRGDIDGGGLMMMMVVGDDKDDGCSKPVSLVTTLMVLVAVMVCNADDDR